MAATVQRLPTASRRKVAQRGDTQSHGLVRLHQITDARAECQAIQGKIDRLHGFLEGYVQAIREDLAQLERAKAAAMRAALGSIQ